VAMNFLVTKFPIIKEFIQEKLGKYIFSKYIIKYVFIAKIRHFGKMKKLGEKKRREKKNCYVAVILFLADICQILTWEI
jgi:hypothetical protein